MVKSFRFGAAQIVLAGTLAFLGVGCNTGDSSTSSSNRVGQTPPTPTPSAAPASPKPAAKPQAAGKPVKPPISEAAVQKSYEEALDKGYSAASISQTALSPEDWKLVESQWQQAIQLLKTVPVSSPQNKLARNKIAEYQKNLAVAKQQSIRAREQTPTESVAVSRRSSTVASSQVAAASLDIILAPIKRRAGGTAVIDVTFNGGQTFEMIVDTGASGTVITSSMAETLGVVPEGAVTADTPSAKSVTFPIGRVSAIEVGGAVINNVPVAIASQLDIGLLGQDFFGNYDVTFKQDVVEFHRR